MTGLSQSQFLQALGWATLNSFWQMALLWCGFLVANQLFNLTANRKYVFSISAIAAGFLSFIVTFILYYQQGAAYQFTFFTYAPDTSFKLMPLFLTAASVTYLLLLAIPAYRLAQNWKFIQTIRKKGLQKVDVQYKLFVKKISGQLGIKKSVSVYVSNLVKSPLTIGYLKPIILLPVACVNNLTIQQTEAVLLHELSHIKRYDYLVNLLICIAHTFLYFNPFVKLFIKVTEEERENCCDQMVLQFGYDKLSYASALLNLEKLAIQHSILVLGATGKKNLLTRIEKIVGMEKKPVFRFTHFAGLVAALLCIFAVNSMIITTQEGKNGRLSFSNLANPFYFLSAENETIAGTSNKAVLSDQTAVFTKKQLIKKVENEQSLIVADPVQPPLAPVPELEAIHVAYNESDAVLSMEAKETVKKTVENTKKVLSTVQWKEVEKAIGEVMTDEEKEQARNEYLKEVENINWQNLEKNLKAEYEKIDWAKINSEIKNALVSVQLDSLQRTYQTILCQLDKASNETNCTLNKVENLPFPDESVNEVENKRKEIRGFIKEIQCLKEKKVIKL